MVRSIPEDYFIKYTSSEGINIGTADRNGPEVYVAIMTTFLSDSYDALEETLNHMKILKLKVIQERMLQIVVQQSWWMLSTLRVPGS